MIEFNTVTDPKTRCDILMQIQEFNKHSYSQSQMDFVIQEFRALHGEQATQELVRCYEQFVLGMNR